MAVITSDAVQMPPPRAASPGLPPVDPENVATAFAGLCPLRDRDIVPSIDPAIHPTKGDALTTREGKVLMVLPSAAGATGIGCTGARSGARACGTINAGSKRRPLGWYGVEGGGVGTPTAAWSGAPVINPSPYLILSAGVDVLRDRFVHHVRAASVYDLERRERGETSTNVPTLEKVLAERLASIDEMEAQDFIDAFTFFEGYTFDRRDEDVLSKAKPALRMTGDKKASFVVVNRWLKYVYLKLWCDGAVLLPLSFKLGSSFRNGEIRSILPPVATCHIDNKHRDMAAFGVSLTLASSWRTFADIDLDVLGPFSLQLGQDYRKREILGLRRRNPYSPFTSALWRWCKAGAGNGFRYFDEEVRGYLYWIECARRGTTDLKPTEFIPDADERRASVLARGRKKGARRVAAAQVELIEHERQAEFKQSILAGDKTLIDVKYEVLAERVTAPEGIVEYVKMIRTRGGVRGSTEGSYPFRMHAFPEVVWAAWDDMFERYFALRKRQGFEGGSGWDTFRYIFKDYLCCYLPWWNELHPGIEMPLPEDPSQFRRFGHWVDDRDETAPLPLLRFFDATRHGTSKDGFNGFISDAQKFFQFCRGDAASLRMRSSVFDNPVVPEVDRQVVRGASKTNKTPIPTAVLPFLLRYAYACEAFFQELGRISLADGLPRTHRRSVASAHRYAEPLTAAAFEDLCGKVGFEFDGRRYDIETVPALAVWEERNVMPPGEDGARTAFLPQISGLRLVIAALETGIRFQGLQWLCRKTYRSLVDARTATAELVPLVVNTDKVKDRPWKTLIVRRAYELLLREEAYQDLLADAFIDRPVFYEKREHTRFAPVLPLFRGAQSEGPISDKTYATAWERLIVGFAQWYERQMPGDEPLRMWRFEPDIDPMTKQPRVAVHVDGGEERPCCPLRVRLRHTPHSARSTFITARSGILPIELTGWLVGQTNKATTYHYTVESEDEIGRKIMAAASSLWEPDRENPVHIRADNVNSALRRSFEADRTRTESAFGFQTLSLLNAEAPDTDGVTLLRSTPMGRVVFRETHICPVGEMCPSNLMDVLVEPRRCGVCPLAVKSVDHLPSIAAKCRHLLEQVREGAKIVSRMRDRGEPSATVEEVQQRRRVDLMEYEGWRTTLHTLTAKLGELRNASDHAGLFHVGMPEAVRMHLSLVTRDADMAEFLLQRICDSAWHTAFETPTLRAQATQLRQRLLASSRALDAEIDLYEDDPVRSVLSTLRLSLASRGIGATYAAALDALRLASIGERPPVPRLPEPERTGI